MLTTICLYIDCAQDDTGDGIGLYSSNFSVYKKNGCITLQ